MGDKLNRKETQWADHLEVDLCPRFHITCLFLPQGLWFISGEKALQILPPGHSSNPCYSLLGSGRQNRGIYRAGGFFPGKFSTWISFYDTFKQSLRIWSFNTHSHIYMWTLKATSDCVLFEPPEDRAPWLICSPPKPSGAGTPRLEAVGRILVNQVFLLVCMNWEHPACPPWIVLGRKEETFIKGEENLGALY